MQRYTGDEQILPDLIDLSGLADGPLTITATAYDLAGVTFIRIPPRLNSTSMSLCPLTCPIPTMNGWTSTSLSPEIPIRTMIPMEMETPTLSNSPWAPIRSQATQIGHLPQLLQ